MLFRSCRTCAIDFLRPISLDNNDGDRFKSALQQDQSNEEPPGDTAKLYEKQANPTSLPSSPSERHLGQLRRLPRLSPRVPPLVLFNNLLLRTGERLGIEESENLGPEIEVGLASVVDVASHLEVERSVVGLRCSSKGLGRRR